jgi:hypothetical protein
MFDADNWYFRGVIKPMEIESRRQRTVQYRASLVLVSGGSSQIMKVQAGHSESLEGVHKSKPEFAGFGLPFPVL